MVAPMLLLLLLLQTAPALSRTCMMAGFAKPPASKEKPKAAPPPPDLTGLRKHDLAEGAMFMGGWVIEDASVTDGLIEEFEKQKKAGKTLKGQISMKGGTAPVVNKEIKDSQVRLDEIRLD